MTARGRAARGAARRHPGARAASSTPAGIPTHRARGRRGTAARAAARAGRQRGATGAACCPALTGAIASSRPTCRARARARRRRRARRGARPALARRADRADVRRRRPSLVGNALGGAIAARFAAAHGPIASRSSCSWTRSGSRRSRRRRASARRCTRTSPSRAKRRTTRLWRRCAHDLRALRERMATPWAPFATDNVERARTPGVSAALGALMERFAAPGDPRRRAGADRRADDAVWGRHDRATPLAVAEAARDRHGWPLHVIDGAADDPPIEQPGGVRAHAARGAGRRRAGSRRCAGALGSAVLEPRRRRVRRGDARSGTALAVRRRRSSSSRRGAADVAAALEPRPRLRPARRRARARPQHRRRGAGGRRADARHGAAALRPGRPGGAHRDRRRPAARSATSTARRSGTAWPRRSASSPASASPG